MSQSTINMGQITARQKPTPYLGQFVNTLPYLMSFAALFLAWHLAANYFVRSVLFPSPASVLAKAIELLANGALVDNVFESLQRIALGFLLGSAFGVPIGSCIRKLPVGSQAHRALD
jgi:ABC-type nitrate/sulfonate/bicarbonate transport system permease component